MDSAGAGQIQRRVLFRTLVALLVLGGALVALVAVPLHRDLVEKNKREVEFIVDARRMAVEQYVTRLLDVASQLASRTQARKTLIEYNEGKITKSELVSSQSQRLSDAMKNSADVVGVTQLDERGELAVVVGAPIPEQELRRVDRSSNQVLVLTPALVNDRLPYVLVVAAMLEGQRQVGLEVVMFKPDTLEELIRDYGGLGKTGEVFLVRRSGDRVASLFPTRRSVDAAALDEALRSFERGDSAEQQAEHAGCEGCVVAVRSIGRTPWSLFFRMESAELNAIIDASMVRLLILSGIVLLLGMAGVHRLTSPLVKTLGDELRANALLVVQVEAARAELEERVRVRTLELSHKNSELKGVFDATRQGLLTIDRAGNVVGEVSASAARWLGELIEGTRLADVLAKVDQGYARGFTVAFTHVVGGGVPLAETLAKVPRRLVIERRPLDLELRPVGGEAKWSRMLVVISDVTEEERRKKLEVELRHSQKLQSVGQLAAGVAHEINTPAQYASDSLAYGADGFRELQRVLEAYRRALKEPDPRTAAEVLASLEKEADLAFLEENAPAAFERARVGLERIATLVRAMTEFAHADSRVKEAIDLNQALRNTLVIAHHEYKYVADIEEDYGELPLVQCHPEDINQVFLHLLVNAAHTIADVVTASGGRGRIRVRTAREGAGVRISISDTGCGIAEEIRGRVFDPFFTTKPVGKGSGQGLAIANSIVVDKHGGTLSFDTEVGKGTTFIVTLPTDGQGTPAAGPMQLAHPGV